MAASDLETKPASLREAFEDSDDSFQELTVEAEDTGTRLDVWVTKNCQELSRSYVQKLITDGLIKVNDDGIKANYKVKAGDCITIEIPPDAEVEVVPEDIPLDVLYEDSDVIVINKPKGMVVHPAPGNYSGTLVNALLWHCKDLSGINGMLRPGIVHRLDKDTSGVIMAAKNDFAHAGLAEQIKDHTVTRRYLALVHGIMVEPAGVVDAPIGRDPKDRKKMAVVTRNSKNAVTHYKVLDRFKEYTFVECRLETGRTHQIRVHLSYLGHPVVGDPLYGTRKNHFSLKGQLLHAAVLGFYHPRSGEYMEFITGLPKYYENVLNTLKQD